jgi:glycosyltransferase involved in cell wall biosynthesis
MRVLVLSHYFWPEPIPKPLELAQGLQEEGHAVQAVTGFPNYPDGTLYRGYAVRLLARDVVQGIPVIRSFMYPSHGTSLIGRLLNYASFMFSSIGGALAARPFDVMYVWHPPLSVGMAAAAIGMIRRRPFVYDVQDIWPESAIATGFLRPGRLVDWMARLEKMVYRRAAHILVVTEGAKANLVEKGVPPQKITVAPHWYDDHEVRNVPADARASIRARHGWTNRFIVMFAGNIGVLQGLDTVIRACRELPSASGVLVALVGDGVEVPRLRNLAEREGVTDRVVFVERQPAGEIGRYFAAADALLVHLRASPLAPLIIPSKTMAYLAAGRPIVMASVGAAADIVMRSGAGIVVPPDDPLQLASAFERVSSLTERERADMGDRGRQYFQEHFTKQAVLPVYMSALTSCAVGRRPGAG